VQEPIITAPIQTQCGVRNQNGLGFSITGDFKGESQFGEFPWMVAVLQDVFEMGMNLSMYLCGGTLIHPSGQFNYLFSNIIIFIYKFYNLYNLCFSCAYDRSLC
jgi:hypothetical protein